MTTSRPFLAELDEFLRARRVDAPTGSYSARVMRDPVLAQRKIMEEAFEVCLELGAPSPDLEATAQEAADLVFHLLAALVGAGTGWAAVEDVLRERHGHPARDSDYGGHDAADGTTGGTT